MKRTLIIVVGLLSAFSATADAQMGMHGMGMAARMEAREARMDAREARMDGREARMNAAELSREARDARMAARMAPPGADRRELAMEAREYSREARQARMDARMQTREQRQASRVAHRETRQARRITRRRAEWRRLRARIGAQNPHGIQAPIRAELRQHARRIARLKRVEGLALDAENEAAATRVLALFAREDARHERRMTRLTARDDDADETDDDNTEEDSE